MKVSFYGTRGSIPVAESDFLEFGGNTLCILIHFENGRIAILDAGTGIRKLGNDFQVRSVQQYDNIFLGLSHTHWDHIQGFPFFKPAYDPKRKFTVAIYGKDRKINSLANIFQIQMQEEYFPVEVNRMGADINFWQPDVSSYTTPSGVHIVAERHNHPGGAYGYRVTEGDKTLVYCTDVEYDNGIDPDVVNLAKNADLLIHDAQYSPEELEKKKGWGHSSWEQAVEVAEKAGVRRLALFHHDPEHNDAFLLNMERKCKKRFTDSFFAREGSEIEI